MHPGIKTIIRRIAQNTVGRLPTPPSRLTGKLARDGGLPVRDIRFRPWAAQRSGSFLTWNLHVRAAFRRVFRSGVEGLPQPLAKEFAKRWADYCGCRYGLLLPHGTDALRIALMGVLDHDGLDYGGESIVRNFSFIATATAALDRRFGVAFVDIDPDTLLMDPTRVEEAIIPGKTRAIMPVHLFGQPADMTALRAVASKHNLKIIEDAAQAHGSEWETGAVGSLGDAAGFSFQSFKNLSCGEGGALTTNDEEIFERAYSIHNVGRVRIGGARWEHHTLGWNCRPTEYQAALLLHRFRNFEREQAVRHRNFFTLRRLLSKEGSCLKPIAINPGVRRHGMHMFVVRYAPERDSGITFEDFLKTVQSEGLPLYRAYETTMSNQPVLQKLMARRPDYFRVLATPVADKAVHEVAYVAQNVFLGTEADMSDIAAGVRKVQTHLAHRSVSERSELAQASLGELIRK